MFNFGGANGLSVDETFDAEGYIGVYAGDDSGELKRHDVQLLHAHLGNLLDIDNNKEQRKRKIVQILIGPDNSTWQGYLIGLSDDGAVFFAENDGWRGVIAPLKDIPKDYLE